MRIIVESVLSTWIYSVYEKRRTANVAFRSTSLLIWGKFSSKAASGVFRSCTGSPARCFSLPNSGIHSPHCPNGAAVYRPHITAAAYAACVNGEDHNGDFRLTRELMARGVQVEWLPEEQ